MPNLHINLKQAFDLDCLDTAPTDAYDVSSDEHYDPARRAAKRRRIERIANQYLHEKTPLILSAGLKGPFNTGWKNPWAKKSRSNDTAPGPKAGREHIGYKQVTDAAAACGNAREDGTKAGNRTRKHSSLPSPETSRAVDKSLQFISTADEQPDQADAPWSNPTGPHDSGCTEFFSIHTEASITIDTKESNPHWLRRPPSEGVTLNQHKDANTDLSPTRNRTGRRPIDKNGKIQLSPPGATTAVAPSPLDPVPRLDKEWHSSASASMIISSPIKATTATSLKANAVSSADGKQPPSPSPTKCSASNDDISAQSVPLADSVIPVIDAVTSTIQTSYQCTPSHAGNSRAFSAINTSTRTTRSTSKNTGKHPQTFTSLNTKSRKPTVGSTYSSVVQSRNANPLVTQGHSAATNLALLAIEKAQKSASSRRRPSREEIQQSAERCAQRPPSSSAKETTGKAKHIKLNDARCISNNLVTSPTPASSTGLTYRKIGDQSKKRIARKSKPRPVTFSSSPANKTFARPELEAPTQALAYVEESRPARPDIYELPSEASALESDGQQQSFRFSRNSGYSTQAAMMLAQLEFQEESMSFAASKTPGPWVSIQDDTPRPYVEEASLAFTPFSAFNADLDKRHPPDDVLRELPISTQDLFSAASPFAFSTIKKKPVRPQGSSLRFAVFPSSDSNGRVDQPNGTKSPTPLERIPLKERNSKASFASTTSQKGSQDSTFTEFKASRQNVELPQLDFRTSLDHLGPNGDLDFTDRFLRNFEEMA
jgi:hypothetical protein